MSEQGYLLPDILRDWPWTRQLNPYYLQVKAESVAWVESFRPFDARAQKAFDECDFNLVAALMYSGRDQDFLRFACDLMNWYFVLDEFTDVAEASMAKSITNTVVSVLKNPEAKSDNPHVVGEMMRQIFKRASTLGHLGCPALDHFIETTEAYVNAVAQEAEDRMHNRIRPVEDFLRLRRDTSAARTVLGINEFGLDIPNEVLFHPTVASLTQDGVDMIVIVNDMHSYLREFSSGLGFHNLITTIMVEYNLDLHGALIWLGTYTDAIVSRFLSNMKQIPSWDPDTDRKVKTYIDCIGRCIRGLDDWSFESKRYYGDERLRVQGDRIFRISQASNLPWLDLEKPKVEETKEIPVSPSNRGSGAEALETLSDKLAPQDHKEVISREPKNASSSKDFGGAKCFCDPGRASISREIAV